MDVGRLPEVTETSNADGKAGGQEAGGQEAGVQVLQEFRRRLGRGKEFGLFAVDSNGAISYFATHRLLPPDS